VRVNAVVHGKCDRCHKQSELKANTPVGKMADNGRLTVHKKVKVVLFYAETKSIVAIQRRFRAHFGTRWAPCKQTIYRLCQQFETNGSVLEKKRPRPASVRTPANIEAVRVALTRSPSKSTRRASAESGISHRPLQRILHSVLHFFRYKMTVSHKLNVLNVMRVANCGRLIARILIHAIYFYGNF